MTLTILGLVFLAGNLVFLNVTGTCMGIRFVKEFHAGHGDGDDLFTFMLVLIVDAAVCLKAWWGQ